MNNINNTVQLIAIAIIPVLFAIILHEVSHGYIAHVFGDDTAKKAGRLTLNPLKHIDPFGTILLPIILIFLAGFAFGYAKPVPVNFNKLRNPKRDTGFVAAAGPITNFILAFICFILLKVILINFPVMNLYLAYFISHLMFQTVSGSLFLKFFIYPMTFMLFIGVMINLILGVFNLIPIPPLDGGRIAVSLLPEPFSGYLVKLEPFGIILLLILLLIDPGNFLTVSFNYIINNVVLRNLSL
ncbi:site-2 protease family protein [Candidatus Acidulodesulfobacterium sp. H_13]|uniref:site-2 protease family protein n=1 Tax=Candidatus Acidulodesulfobacterium sp. H_13 TaxID=3395470 RepID=UPI003AF50543